MVNKIEKLNCNIGLHPVEWIHDELIRTLNPIWFGEKQFFQYLTHFATEIINLLHLIASAKIGT